MARNPGGCYYGRLRSPHRLLFAIQLWFGHSQHRDRYSAITGGADADECTMTFSCPDGSELQLVATRSWPNGKPPPPPMKLRLPPGRPRTVDRVALAEHNRLNAIGAGPQPVADRCAKGRAQALATMRARGLTATEG